MLQKQKKTQVWRRKFPTKKKAQNHVRINQQFKWAIVNDITFRCFPTKKRGRGEEKEREEEKEVDRVRERGGRRKKIKREREDKRQRQRKKERKIS